MTVVSWGLYGIFLHNGQSSMMDKDNALYKSFLFVGLAYFLTAVLAPLAHSRLPRRELEISRRRSMGWSLVSGHCRSRRRPSACLLAFAADGKPGVVMSIVFAGAPVVNAVVALALHPPPGGYGVIRWQFYAGILMAALGGFMVTKFKPAPTAPAKPTVSATSPGGSQSAH